MSAPDPYLGGTDDEPLDRNYFVKINNKQEMELIASLGVRHHLESRIIPQRFTLVIDVSSSMKKPPVPGDIASMIQRVKGFAIEFLSSMTNSDWLSIVTFSEFTHIDMEMTQMTEENKVAARSIIESLTTNIGTDIEKGLLDGLDVALKKDPNETQSHDCIILFTDGKPSYGELEPSIIIEKYNEKMKAAMRDGRVNFVQLAAVTFDYYQPWLLNEIRICLSSDAFYVINCNEDFEVDMLLPLYLRQSPYLSDIQINLKCIDAVEFKIDQTLKLPGLQSQTSSETKFLFHVLVQEFTKTFEVKMDISKTTESLACEISITYRDVNLQRRHFKDIIPINLTSMHEVRQNENIVTPSCCEKTATFLKDTSLYSVDEKSVRITWDWMVKSYEKILTEKGRRESILALESNNVNKFKDSIIKINEMKRKAKDLLGESDPTYLNLNNRMFAMSNNLQYTVDKITTIPSARLLAMASSLEMEMPTASSVFEPNTLQPYLKGKVSKKISEVQEKIRDEKIALLQAKFKDLTEDVQTHIATEALTELENSLAQMESVMNQKHYKKTENDLLFYSSSCTKLQNLTEKQLIIDIEKKWKERFVDCIPQNLEKLKKVYSEMQELRQRACKHSDVFTSDDENNLKALKSDIESLEEKTRLRDEAESYLREEMEKDTYVGIKKAVKKVKNVLFVDEYSVEAAKERFKFLKPRTRIKELKEATEGISLERLNQAIKDFKEARVNSKNELLSPAQKRLQVLKDAEPLNTRLNNSMENKDFKELRNVMKLIEDDQEVNKRDIALYKEAVVLKKELGFPYYKKLLGEAIKSEDHSTLSAALKEMKEENCTECIYPLEKKVRKAENLVKKML